MLTVAQLSRLGSLVVGGLSVRFMPNARLVQHATIGCMF
jgi:hypothetical protein